MNFRVIITALMCTTLWHTAQADTGTMLRFDVTQLPHDQLRLDSIAIADPTESCFDMHRALATPQSERLAGALFLAFAEVQYRSVKHYKQQLSDALTAPPDVHVRKDNLQILQVRIHDATYATSLYAQEARRIGSACNAQILIHGATELLMAAPKLWTIARIKITQ